MTIGKYFKVALMEAKTVKQLEGEHTQDYIKFLVYMRMGSTRSLERAYQTYYETKDKVSNLWQTLSTKYRWDERAAEYDALGGK